MTPRTKTPTRAEITRDVLADLRALVREYPDGQPDVPLRNVAPKLVALRSTFSHDGRPDWTGRSPEYRDLIERLYRQARVPSDSESPLQSKIRYHVGNAIRSAAPAEDLSALGLDPEGPTGRMRRSRATRTTRPTQATRRPAAPVAEDHRTRPRVALSGAIADPLVLAGFALDALRAIDELSPRGETAEALEPLLQRLASDTFSLLADLRRR